MTFKGTVTVMGASLVAGETGGDWRMSIRRVDGKREGFSKYHDKEITPEIIREFIPNWSMLEWKELDQSLFSRSESYAEDGAYKINVAAREDKLLSHTDVRDRFAAFMGVR